MKKLFLFFAFLSMCITTSFSQIVTIMEVVPDFGNSFDYYLSDGNNFYVDGLGRAYYFGNRKSVRLNFNGNKVYPKGTMLEKHGNYYELVTRRKVGYKEIKRVRVHEVFSEFKASLNGGFTYNSFLWSRGKGSINGNASGGSRTIINVIFTDNTSVTVNAADDPIWLDAEPGMTVAHYKYNSNDVYELQF